MKLTKEQLRQIIKEELETIMDEGFLGGLAGAVGGAALGGGIPGAIAGGYLGHKVTDDDPGARDDEMIGAKLDDPELVKLFSQRFNISGTEARIMLKPGGKMDRVVGMMTSNEEWSNLSVRQQWARMGKWIFGTGMNQ